MEHKLFAGLRDAYRFTGNRTALDVEIKFAGWVESIVSKLDDEQTQKMLATEFGGMNEVTADLYADTGDPRWLALSGKFEHRAIIDPLAAGQDILGGKHGNTQVPKMIGSLSRYIYTGDETDHKAATFFWDEIALHHSFATGGHGKNEYLSQPDKLNSMIDGRTAETCDVYNMIKMSRTLFSVDPEIRYADFHERALFNHILASQDPVDGRVCYMVPVGRGVQHEYQDKFEDFTCCVGSGMESHALHGYGIYYESADKLWVSLYAPSRANWEKEGVQLEMSTDFPMGQTASLKITPKSAKKFTVALRRPYWAEAGFSVKVNSHALKDLPKPDSYVEITRTWKKGDTVDVGFAQDASQRTAARQSRTICADVGTARARGGSRARTSGTRTASEAERRRGRFRAGTCGGCGTRAGFSETSGRQAGNVCDFRRWPDDGHYICPFLPTAAAAIRDLLGHVLS